jgi:hypothetical protein
MVGDLVAHRADLLAKDTNATAMDIGELVSDLVEPRMGL